MPLESSEFPRQAQAPILAHISDLLLTMSPISRGTGGKEAGSLPCKEKNGATFLLLLAEESWLCSLTLPTALNLSKILNLFPWAQTTDLCS